MYASVGFVDDDLGDRLGRSLNDTDNEHDHASSMIPCDRARVCSHATKSMYVA